MKNQKIKNRLIHIKLMYGYVLRCLIKIIDQYRRHCPDCLLMKKNQKFNHVFSFASSNTLFGIRRRCALPSFKQHYNKVGFFSSLLKTAVEIRI